MKNHQSVFDSWKQDSLRDFWLISQEFLSADSDFIELLDRMTYQIKRGRLKNSADCDRYLFNLLIKTLGERRRSLMEKIYLLALFRLNWPLEKLSSLTNDYVSKIKFVVIQSLKEKIDLKISNLPLTDDCCRTELYLLDYIFERHWRAPFKNSFNGSSIKDHVATCARCQSMVESAKGIQNPMVVTRSQEFNYQYPYTKTARNKMGFKLVEIYQNMALHWRGLLQIAAVTVLLAVITSIPFLGKLLINRESRSENLANKTTDVGTPEQATWVDLTLEKDLISPPWLVSENLDTKEVSLLRDFLINYAPNKITEVAIHEPDKNSNANSPLPEAKVLREIKTKAELANEVAANDGSLWTFYRWGAYSEDLDSIVPQILNVLVRYSVEKAGELDLGAEYRGGRYFHFSVKKENIQSILNELQIMKIESFTRVEAKSDRKNKEGQSRVVFLLKQK